MAQRLEPRNRERLIVAWYNSPNTPAIASVATPVWDSGALGSVIGGIARQYRIADIIKKTVRNPEETDADYQSRITGANALENKPFSAVPEEFDAQHKAVIDANAPQHKQEPLSDYSGRMADQLALLDPSQAQQWRQKSIMQKASEDWANQNPQATATQQLTGQGSAMYPINPELGSQMLEKGAQTGLVQQGRQKEYLQADLENEKSTLERMKQSSSQSVDDVNKIAAQIGRIQEASNRLNIYLGSLTGNPVSSVPSADPVVKSPVDASTMYDKNGELRVPSEQEYSSWNRQQQDAYNALRENAVKNQTTKLDLRTKMAQTKSQEEQTKVDLAQKQSQSADQYFSGNGSPYAITATKYKVIQETRPAIEDINNPDPNIRAKNRAIIARNLDAITSAAEGGSVGERAALEKTGLFTRIKNSAQALLGDDAISDDQVKAYVDIMNTNIKNINSQISTAKKDKQFKNISYQPLNFLSSSKSSSQKSNNGGEL